MIVTVVLKICTLNGDDIRTRVYFLALCAVYFYIVKSKSSLKYHLKSCSMMLVFSLVCEYLRAVDQLEGDTLGQRNSLIFYREKQLIGKIIVSPQP